MNWSKGTVSFQKCCYVRTFLPSYFTSEEGIRKGVYPTEVCLLSIYFVFGLTSPFASQSVKKYET